MAKKITGLVLTLIVFTTSYGQYKVSGKFVDTKNAPVDYLEVIISVKDSVMKADVTNMEGQFTFRLAKGNYKLMANYFGENVFQKEVNVSGPLDMGVIQVDLSTKLEEITVRGGKKLIERKVDRLVFNVEKSVISSLGNSLDVLGTTPLLRVTNNRIELVGKDNLSIIVNGRSTNLSGDDLISFLKSISSEQIAKIEVITNPPSKYEAEGNSGIINIVLKKNIKDYFGGTVFGRCVQTKHTKGYLGGVLNYNKSKISSSLSITGGLGNTGSDENYTIFYPDKPWVSDIDRVNLSKFISTRIGIDYNLSQKSVIGIQYSGSVGRPESEIKVTNTLSNPFTKATDSLILTNTKATLKTFYNSFNAHYQHNIDSIGKKVIFDIDFYNSNNDEVRGYDSSNFLPTGEFIDNSQQSALINTENKIVIYSSKIDVELPFKKINFSLGAKIVFSDNTNGIDFYDTTNGNRMLDTNQSNRFVYTENVQALYINLQKKFAEKWNTQLGFRLENTYTKGNSITTNIISTDNYLKLFPTAYVVYNMDDKKTFSFSYGRRLNRPSYAMLNPFRLYKSPYSYVEGNPSLQPSFTDNIELSFVYDNDWVTTLYASKTKNAYESVTMVSSTSDKQVTSPLNFLTHFDSGISQFATIKITAWWESHNQAYFYYNRSKSNIKITSPDNQGFSGYISSNNSLKLNTSGSISSELNFWYQFPEKFGIDQAEAMYNLDIRFRFLLYKRLNLSVYFNDIFRSNSYKSVTKVNNIRQRYSNYWDNQQIRISLSFKFLNKKLKTKNRQGSNEDERNRI